MRGRERREEREKRERERRDRRSGRTKRGGLVSAIVNSKTNDSGLLVTLLTKKPALKVSSNTQLRGKRGEAAPVAHNFTCGN